MNARIQYLAMILVILSGFIIKFTVNEWIAVTICIALVLSLEAINTAIELLANEVTLEKRESIRNIKDLAAGAVLLAALGSCAVAFLIGYRHFAN